MTGALAVAGSYHAVSAASAVLVSATSISGKVGTRLSYQIKISDGEGRTPESWLIDGQSLGKSGSTKAGMPPGLSLGLGTGIISGIPTQGGTFDVPIAAYEHAKLTGAELNFVLTFTIEGGTSPPTITVPPTGTSEHTGERLNLSVTATGTEPITYQWRHNGLDLTNQITRTLQIDAVTEADAGDYLVVVSNPNGSVSSTAATVAVVPLSIRLLGIGAQGATLSFGTIPGRGYWIESTDSLDAPWTTVNQTTATDQPLTYVDGETSGIQRFWRYRIAP